MTFPRPTRWWLPPLLALALAGAAAAPPAASPGPVRDLGQGLSYLRVGAVARAPELGATLRAVPALVLDLRQATVVTGDAADLARALTARTARGPLFVLVSPATPPALAAALDQLPTGSVILGVPGSQPPPQVVVSQTPAEDQRAYAALDAGRTLDELISGKLEKERFDEAALMQEFKQGGAAASAAEPAPEPEAETAPPAAPAAPPAPAAEAARPPVDRVLQRAVQLHRALRAIQPRA